jgi:hypothetical protein
MILETSLCSASGPRSGQPGPLTCGRQQKGAVLAVQVLHGSDPGIPRVSIVEIVQLLPFLPVPKA